jgi:K+-sensing histidine kinase KdpD
MHDSYIKNHLKTNKKNIIGIGREVLGLRRNGNEFPMDLMVSRVYQNGEPVFIGIIRDITEKKRVDDLRTQFITAASRDILGPLNLISEAINILHSDNSNLPPETMTHLVEMAQKNSSHLQKLMHDLIEMQNLSKSNAQLHFTSQAALPLIEETINENNIYNNIDLIKPITNNLMIHTDAQGFIQAFGHLLQYLQKLSARTSKITVRIDEDKGKIKFTLRTTKKADSDNHNATSAPPNNPSSRHQLLDSNYYAENKLGLEIAKEIIEKMHGKMTQETTVDELIFVLHFPQSTHYS